MKFSIKNFFSKYDQVRSFLLIWSYLLKKSLVENFIFCAVRLKNLISPPLDAIKIIPKTAQTNVRIVSVLATCIRKPTVPGSCPAV